MSLLSLAGKLLERIVEIVHRLRLSQPEVDSAVLACDLTKPDAAYASLSADELAFLALGKNRLASRRKQLKTIWLWLYQEATKKSSPYC